MLHDVIARMALRPERREFPAELRQHFAEHGVPDDIIEDLAQSTYHGWLPIGPVDLIPMADFLSQTHGIAICLEHGLLPVAGCKNFDPVVVECATRRVGYVCHESLWGEDWADISQCLCRSPYLWEEFWEQAFDQKTFPTDFNEAQNQW